MKDRFEYIKIDTYYIDKTSSSKLSKAINSIYQQYQEASVCYMFLSDILDTSSIGNDLKAIELILKESKWFIKGCKYDYSSLYMFEKFKLCLYFPKFK